MLAQLSVEGRMDGTPFSYLGTETLGFACAESCRMEEGPHRMFAVLEALRARRVALAQGASSPEVAAAAARGVAAWFIRVDREDAVVGEADASGIQHRLTLHEEGKSFRFLAGLP